MCATCGCSDPEQGFRYKIVTRDTPAEEPETHGHEHAHIQGPQTVVSLERDILDQNKLVAARNRGFFAGRGMVVINLVSSPGSGKTSLLEATLTRWNPGVPVYVIEGDQQTDNDARRIARTGARAIQINTGTGCHLDAPMISDVLRELRPEPGSVLFIENIGNLVCPALFDLGEHARVVIMSTTEGEDKPLKYPTMFHSSHLCLINKTDLLPYVDFSLEKASDYVYRVSHVQDVIPVSATKGEGLERWFDWLDAVVAQVKQLERHVEHV